MDTQMSRAMRAGDYGAAEERIQSAKIVATFIEEVEIKRKAWRELSRGAKQSKRGDRTPTWRFYKPIAQTLVELGGRANDDDLAAHLERSVDGILQSGDHELSKGVPRWKMAALRARRPMIKEGFLAKSERGEWQIANEGRRLAKGQVEVARPDRDAGSS